jgi:hypothetical protein
MTSVKNKKLEPFVRRLETLQEHADQEPIDRYLHESQELLRDLERSLPAHDGANVFYETIESYLQSGRVGDALERMRDEKLVDSGWWLLPSILILAALGAGAFGVHDLVTATESVSWPTTQGTVMISKVVITRSTGGAGRVGMPGSRVGGEGSSKTSHVYTPEVVYEYTVGDRSYRNDRVAIAHVGDEEEANAIVARYPVDARVTVHYDPDDPGTSVLEAGTRSSTYVGLGLCAGFLAVALLLPLLPRLRRRTLADRRAAEKKG